MTISPEVLRALAEAEVARAEKSGSAATGQELDAQLRLDSIERIVEQARKLAEEQGEVVGKDGASLGEQAVRQELESLYSALGGAGRGVDPADLKCDAGGGAVGWGKPTTGWRGHARRHPGLWVRAAAAPRSTGVAPHPRRPGMRSRPVAQAHQGERVWGHHFLGHRDQAPGHAVPGAGGGGQRQPVSGGAAAGWRRQREGSSRVDAGQGGVARAPPCGRGGPPPPTARACVLSPTTCRRGKREEVFKEVCDKVAAMFGAWRRGGSRGPGAGRGRRRRPVARRSAAAAAHPPLPARLPAAPGDKYVVRLVEDTESMLDDMQAGAAADGAPQPRVQFEILPAAAAQPQATAPWQRAAASVLLVLTLGSTLQFGLAANIGLLPKVREGWAWALVAAGGRRRGRRTTRRAASCPAPPTAGLPLPLPLPCAPVPPQETLQWLADPANLNTDVLPPGLESFDPLPFLSSTGNVFMVTLLPQVRRGVWVCVG